MGMLDNVFNHNPYSGYGALVLFPLAAGAVLSMLGSALTVTLRARRR
jgi:hypothetical protein